MDYWWNFNIPAPSQIKVRAYFSTYFITNYSPHMISFDCFPLQTYTKYINVRANQFSYPDLNCYQHFTKCIASVIKLSLRLIIFCAVNVLAITKLTQGKFHWRLRKLLRSLTHPLSPLQIAKLGIAFSHSRQMNFHTESLNFLESEEK